MYNGYNLPNNNLNTQVFYCNNGDFQIWKKPPGAQLIHIICIGAGAGGGGGGSSGGGGGVSAPSVGSVGGGQEQQQQPLTQRFVNINLSGSDNSMYSKGAVRDLITRINEEVKDGAVLRVL